MTIPTTKIALEECIKGRIYETWCRNLGFGVYDGNGGFIGIRTKFKSRFLFTELHWDADEHHGTVRGMRDTGVDTPEGIVVAESLGTIDSVTDREVYFDKPISQGDKGWVFKDTGESDSRTCPTVKKNRPLFSLLEIIETGVLDMEKEELLRLYAATLSETHRLQCKGTFSLDRDPFTLMPAIDAYADGEITGGKMRECIRRWLSGTDFRQPENREWEKNE
jgi:hypothetical protein